jgi:D-alanyl-D-alanine carboxypeptidase/D-alanyl-D-alanine-endopeptidase (penicillin-binding protein 4)
VLVPRPIVGAAVCACALLVASAPSAHAVEPSAALSTSLRHALVARDVDSRRTAALAVDLRSGEVVFGQNDSLALAPASSEKLAVTLAALRDLGPSYRFRTEVAGRGRSAGHVWEGNLFLVGSGDPTLDLRDVDALAHKVAARGITRVTGRVLGDEHRFDSERGGPGWKPSFLGIESAPLSALSVGGVTLRTTNSSAFAAAQAFRDALIRRGVRVAGVAGRGRAPLDALPLAYHRSAPLSAVVREMNHESDNFVAEMLLKELGATIAGRGSTAAGRHVVRDALADAGVPLDGVRLADGSGLSLRDRLTVRALVAILESGSSDLAIRDDFVSSLSVAGVSGTLEHRLAKRPMRGRVRAKTGTTNQACALAGFVGTKYVFAILQNGSPVDYWSARVAQDRFVTVLARR